MPIYIISRSQAVGGVTEEGETYGELTESVEIYRSESREKATMFLMDLVALHKISEKAAEVTVTFDGESASYPQVQIDQSVPDKDRLTFINMSSISLD